jgi:hypothetical protein
VYLGTAFADVNTATTSSSQFKGNQGGTTYDPGALSPSTAYYWRIDEVNSPNTVKGDVWNFTTGEAVGKATSPSPANSATGVSVNADLSWTAGNGAASHNVFFGTSSSAVTNATTSSSEFKGNQGGTTYDPGTMSYVSTYYWRIDEVNSPYTATGDVWSFTTGSVIGKATNPSPSNGASNVSITVDLSWTAGSGAASHNVFLGTSSSAVTNATTSSSEFKGNQGGTTYDPGTLTNNVHYYWRIDEYNNPYTATGDVWDFTTVDANLTLIDMKKGPYMIYENNDTAMTVMWQLESTSSCTISWGTDTTCSMGSHNTSEYGSDHQHKYTITGLSAGTKYYYKVVIGSTYYDTGSFRTAPTGDKLKFIAYGDSRTNYSDHDGVDAQILNILSSDPNYQTILIMTGDYVAEGDTESYWTNEFFRSSQTHSHSLHSKMPLNGCRGNHERTGAVWSKYFPYPYAGNYYWSFDYGPAHFTFIDEYISFSSGSAQYNWIVNDLNSTDKEWKFVAYHEPAYSADGYHGDRSDVQNTLQPLFVTYNVDVVLTGHTHNYSRCTVNGVTHITTGGAGAPLVTPDPDFNQYIDYCEETYHFCEVAIDGNTLTFRAVRDDGSLMESFNLYH